MFWTACDAGHGMACARFAKVAKGGEGGKAGVAVLDGFVGVLCAASICRLLHLYRLLILAAREHFRLKFNEVHFFWQMKSNDRPGASLVSVHSGCTLSGNLLSCLLGTLDNVGTQSIVIQLIWKNVGTNSAITAAVAVSSDVPDSVATNNAASITITQDMTANNNADIPMLP